MRPPVGFQAIVRILGKRRKSVGGVRKKKSEWMVAEPALVS